MIGGLLYNSDSMKISLSTIKQLIDFELPEIGGLVERVNQRLGQIEEVIDLGAKYKDAKIARVVECRKHPNADKLSVTKIDDGGSVDGVERDENGLIQVVCGAPNVHSDMWVVWLPPGSVVPETFDDPEPFCLAPKELRGIVSNGMLASEQELGLSNSHEGIVELKDSDLPASGVSTLDSLKGVNFSEVFGLDDYIIDIENKMFTHRPDLFGHLGVAREISGIFEKNFTSPNEYLTTPEFSYTPELKLDVINNTPEASSRFMTATVKGVTIADSPMWLKCQLVAMGARPISNVVDLTNYTMLMSAQPIHAYDYDKLRGAKLGVRFAESGERVTLLNGKECQLDKEDIVIVDGEGVIGLAGVMGGLDTEVTSETKNVVFEVAHFDMYKIRKTSMRYGVFSDAVTRFTKGQSFAQTDRVVGKILELLPNGQLDRVVDVSAEHADTSSQKAISIDIDFINQRLGSSFTSAEVIKILESTEFKVSMKASGNLSIIVPFWRTDIGLSEDVVEEVGRLYGFDKLPRKLPERSTMPVSKNSRREVKQKIRESLSKAGANETLNYSFVNEKILHNASQDVKKAFRLSNALSPDLQYYRLSVLPSLLDKIHANIRNGHNEFVLFEIGKGHVRDDIDRDGLPTEKNFVDLVYAAKDPGMGATYFHVRRMVQQIGLDFGFSVNFLTFSSDDNQAFAMFEPDRSALIASASGDILGVVGEFRQSVIKSFKLPERSAGATFDLDSLERVVNQPRQIYSPLSNYPSTSQDISLRVDVTVSYGSVFDTVRSAVSSYHDIETTITPISIYQPADDKSIKTITLRLKFTNRQKTLSDGDVAPIIQNVVGAAAEKVSASVV